MPIDKYLFDIKKPDFTPGPFAIRLKYEMKQVLFCDKHKNYANICYGATIISLSFICLLFVLKPSAAQSLNNLVFGYGPHDTIDMLFSEEGDIDLSYYNTSFRNVQSGLNGTLPFIEEDKSYLVQKFKNNDNKTLIYFSEVKQPKTIKILH